MASEFWRIQLRFWHRKTCWRFVLVFRMHHQLQTPTLALPHRGRENLLTPMPSKIRPARALRLEPLEPRHLLATVTVTNNLDTVNGDVSSIAALELTPGDDGISIREAIEAANNTTGADEILFDINNNGGHDGPETILLTGSELLFAVRTTGHRPRGLKRGQCNRRSGGTTRSEHDLEDAGYRVCGVVVS